MTQSARVLLADFLPNREAEDVVMGVAKVSQPFIY
jgi:hypothetical protein